MDEDNDDDNGAASTPISTLQLVKKASSQFSSPNFSLARLARNALSNLIVDRVTKQLTDGLKAYLESLPAVERQVILEELTSYQPAMPDSTSSVSFVDIDAYRSKYLESVLCFWQLLYSSSFQAIVIPNLQTYLVAGNEQRLCGFGPGATRWAHSRLAADDAASAEAFTANQNTLAASRCRPSNVTSNLMVSRTPTRFTHETYASILGVIADCGPSSAKQVQFGCYGQRSVSTMKEKALVFSLIENLRNVRVLDLGKY
jgi:hypothetical protein